MAILLIPLVGFLFAIGAFLMMRPHLVKFALGLMCFTNGANLLIFSAGRLTSSAPPVILQGESRLLTASANPVSQALILTAIVIGFGFLAFTLVLVSKLSVELGTVDSREAVRQEEDGVE